MCRISDRPAARPAAEARPAAQRAAPPPGFAGGPPAAAAPPAAASNGAREDDGGFGGEGAPAAVKLLRVLDKKLRQARPRAC